MVLLHFAGFGSPDEWFCFILQGLAVLMGGFRLILQGLALQIDGLLHFVRFGNPDKWFCFILEGLEVLMRGVASFRKV